MTINFFLQILMLGAICVPLGAKDVRTIFAHGAYAHPGQAKRFYPAFPESDNVKAVKFEDSQKETSVNPFNRAVAYEVERRLRVDFSPSKAYFGSGPDIHTVGSQIASEGKKQVLFGCCRGGIAAIKALAQSDVNLENVKALVVEGTPSSVVEAYNEKLGKFGISTGLSERLFKTIWSSYPAEATSTLESVKNIKNKKLPILLVHSQDDANFSFDNALKLYIEFKKEHFENVYIAPLKGRHAWSLKDDRENYLTAVHSFYKEHNLPHDKQYATQGMQHYSYDLDKAKSIIDDQQTKLQQLISYRQKQLGCAAVIMGCGCYYGWEKYQSRKKIVKPKE